MFGSSTVRTIFIVTAVLGAGIDPVMAAPPPPPQPPTPAPTAIPSEARLISLKKEIQPALERLRNDMEAYVNAWVQDILKETGNYTDDNKVWLLFVGGATVYGNEGFGVDHSAFLNYMRHITGRTSDAHRDPKMKGTKPSLYRPLVISALERAKTDFKCGIFSTEASHEIPLDSKTLDDDNEISYKNMRYLTPFTNDKVCQEWTRLLDTALERVLKKVAIVCSPLGGANTRKRGCRSANSSKSSS